MNFCKDCKYCVPWVVGWWIFRTKPDYDFAKCTRGKELAPLGVNPVTGEEHWADYCRAVRLYREESCEGYKENN